jgi:hypothetical protein
LDGLGYWFHRWHISLRPFIWGFIQQLKSVSEDNPETTSHELITVAFDRLVESGTVKVGSSTVVMVSIGAL